MAKGTNYAKGRRAEYLLKHELEAMGWSVLRTAGSHGFADLIVIDEASHDCKVRFIQVKTGNAQTPVRPISFGDHYTMELWRRKDGQFVQEPWKNEIPVKSRKRLAKSVS